MNKAESHWENVYRTKAPDAVSWYRPHLDRSLYLIESAVPDKCASIIDVGAGESTLVDDLLARGYRQITALDISQIALAVTKKRLGTPGLGVRWICGDITLAPFVHPVYDMWHDRAVFHFLTEVEQRQRYVNTVLNAVKPGGHVIVGTFGPEGPPKCSGLYVMRYSAEQLHGAFGGRFRLIETSTELHLTPSGTTQQFLYCYCRMA